MKSRRVGILSAVFLIVGALVLMVLRWSAASEAVYPFERLVRAGGRAVGRGVSGAFSGASAAAENARLRREVAVLSLVRGDLERLRSENARLRRALGFTERRPESWIVAEVLSSGGGASAARSSIRVAKGSLDGVKSGAVAVVPEGLVGRVTAVSPHTAEVMLLTDPSVKVSCEIRTGASERIHGILSGGGADRLLLRHLDHAAPPHSQPKVFSSGFGGVFPAGFEIGTLLPASGIRGVDGEVRPCVDYSTLEDVFIRRDQ